MKILVALICLSIIQSAPAREMLVYVGTYASATSRGIYVSRLDAETGHLTAPELAVETPSPSYLAVAPGEQYLYAANSVPRFNGEAAGAVSAFAIDHPSGRLTLLNQKSSGDAGPCHLCPDHSGRALLVANYDAGSVLSLALNPDGSVGDKVSFLRHHGASVNPQRQAGPHAHAIYPDPSNRFALACDLGTDQVVVYHLQAATAALTPAFAAPLPPGSGPRHLAFSADGKFVHVVNEMACSVSTFRWHPGSGKLDLIETVSALPGEVKVRSEFTAAEIVCWHEWVIATLRGHDSLTVFRADARTGRLTQVQNLPAGGRVPRGMGLDPSGRWLLVGNQDSGRVTEFALNPKTGWLTATGEGLDIGSPVDVKFVRAGGGR